MSKNKSRAVLQAELNAVNKFRLSETISQVILSLIRWGGVVLIARYGALAIDSLAGKSTMADIGVNFLANVQVSVLVSWASGVGGIGYGVYQRKLRKDTVERLQSRIQSLERKFDVKRSSSNITARGDTRQEDE